MQIDERITSTTVGDWDYDLYRLTDGRYAVVWEGRKRATDDHQRLICPVGLNVPGDHTGARLFDDRAAAVDYYETVTGD